MSLTKPHCPMDAPTLLLFVPACFALNMAPGPNNLLSLNNSARYGFRNACIGALGRIVAFGGMIALASAGMAVILQTSEMVFYAMKAIGSVYLLYLAVKLWRSPSTPVEIQKTHGTRGPLELAKQEFLVAIGNPKAILIFTAFLPQFVNPSLPTAGQFTIVGALFLALEFVAISFYAGMGLHMRQLFSTPGAKRIFNRGCATLLGAAGLGILFARKAASGS